MDTDLDRKFACERCGATFTLRRAPKTRWGDAVCPACGSVRIARVVTRLEKLAAFLIDYERY